MVTTDRGLHNRGLFSQTLQANGVLLRTAALEAPSQLGRCERHGGIFKENLLHVVTVHKVIGKKAMEMAQGRNRTVPVGARKVPERSRAPTGGRRMGTARSRTKHDGLHHGMRLS